MRAKGCHPARAAKVVIPHERANVVIPYERAKVVIPHERAKVVIPHERSECRDLARLDDPAIMKAMRSRRPEGRGMTW